MNCHSCNAPIQSGQDYCPHCGAPINASYQQQGGYDNSDNPYAPPAGSFDSGFSLISSGSNPSLATWQKLLSYTILALVVLAVLYMIVVIISAIIGGVIGAQMGMEAGSQGQIDQNEMQQRLLQTPVFSVLQILGGITSLLYMTASLFGVLAMIMTWIHSKFNAALGVLVAFTVLCPCVNLIPLILVNVQAATILKSNGTRVGWFGAY